LSGSPTVYTNNLQQGRVGDPVRCGTKVATGSPDVFVGENNDVPDSSLFSGAAADPPRPLSRSEYAGLVNNSANRGQYRTPYNEETGQGDNPEVGPAEPGQEPSEVTLPECEEQDQSLSPNQRVHQTARARLEEAKTGAWREGGNNKNIMQLYADVGVPQGSDSVHWCAAFTGSVLKRSCSGYKRTLRAADYNNYGQPLDKTNPSSWQPGDVIVFKRDGGSGHVAIIDRVDPATGKVYVIGGNQSNNVTLSARSVDPSRIQAVNRPT
jgi:uncharacterized protein (TIGR02594 family)